MTPVAVEHIVELRERREAVIDCAGGEPGGFPLEHLLADVFPLDAVPAPVRKPCQPCANLVFAVLGTSEALLHDAHEARNVRRQRVALHAQAVALKAGADVGLPAFHFAHPRRRGKALLLPPLVDAAVAGMGHNAIATVVPRRLRTERGPQARYRSTARRLHRGRRSSESSSGIGNEPSRLLRSMVERETLSTAASSSRNITSALLADSFLP